MRLFTYFILTALLISNAYGQGAVTRNSYAWSIGVQTGVTSYYGDLNYKYNLPNRNDIMSTKHLSNLDSRAVGLTLEKRLSGALALSLNGLYGNVTGNDRTQNWSGTLKTDNPNFDRSLNFRTEFYDANISLVYKAANGFLIRKNARFAPYLSAGIGITSFNVYGDLYTPSEGRYYYWKDGTIRDLAQNDPNAFNAVEIEQDRKYETNTTKWKTEGKAYPTVALNIPVALGLKYRIADRWDISLQASARFLFSDYFDDVSGAKYAESYNSPQQAYIANPNAANWNMGEHSYRGNPDNKNDVFGAVTVGLNYRFGQKLRNFSGSRFYTQEPYAKAPQPITPPPTRITPPPRVTPVNPPSNQSVVVNVNPTNNDTDLMTRMALLNARLDSLKRAEMQAKDDKIKELELRLAKLEVDKELDRIRNDLSNLTGRVANLENRQPVAVAPTPVYVNTPMPAAANNTYLTSEINVGLNKASIHFANESYVISRHDYIILDAIANELQKDNSLICYIDGHASTTGTAAYNKVLSENRANAIRNYLISKGVSGTRILTASFGFTNPVYRSSLDRRVEITIMNH